MKGIEFKSLTTYDKAFGLTKLLFVVFAVLIIASAGAYVYITKQEIAALQNTVYVLAPNGEISQALKSSNGDGGTREFEYAAHAKKAYKLWYEFDEGSFKQNTEEALVMFGNCGKELLNEYKEQNVERTLKGKNIKLFAYVDSIKINMNNVPVSGEIFGKQKIQRLGGEMIRFMNCAFTVYDYDRSFENPHGVKLEDWVVTNAEVISDIEK